MVATGAATVAAIAAIRIDVFFLGVTAIHPVHGFSTGDYEEAAVKRAVLGQAAETFVVATAEKFGAASPHHVASAEDIAGLILPEDMSGDALEPYRDRGVALLPA
ncbi:hypothetical protein D9M72_600930 [compost metagenome]